MNPPLVYRNHEKYQPLKWRQSWTLVGMCYVKPVIKRLLHDVVALPVNNEYSINCNSSSNNQSSRVGMVLASLVAGGVAGLAVDTLLFPLDTIKTRLQAGSSGLQGWVRVRQLYSGLGPVLLGSVPCAALFFLFYDGSKEMLGGNRWTVHMVAASIGEVGS